MSTRSLSTGKLELPTTPESLKPLQQLVLRWGWKVTSRKDVIPTIVPTYLGIDLGAPAVFVPSTAQIYVPEHTFEHLDASRIESIDQFIVEHPRKAGRFVHEFLHAAHSPGPRFLENYHRANGNRHYTVLSTLLEGHCETRGWGNLRPIEQAALSEVVFEVVLEDLIEEGQDSIDFKSPHTAANLLGLIAARVNGGIIDVSEPKANAVYVSTVAALGGYFDGFWDIAVRFADTEVGWNTDYELRMTELVQEWIDLLDSFIKDNTPEKQPEEPEGGEPKDEESEEEDEPTGEDDEESEEEGDDGTGNGGGEQGEEDGEDGYGGSDPLTDQEGGTTGGFGTYAHAHQPDLPDFDPSALEDAIKNLEEADRDAKHNSEKMIKIHVAAVHEATANWHEQRRAWNKEQAKQWR